MDYSPGAFGKFVRISYRFICARSLLFRILQRSGIGDAFIYITKVQNLSRTAKFRGL